MSSGRFSARFSSLRARIFWSIVPAVALLLVFQGWMNVREQRRLVMDEFIKHGQAVASHLASSSELAVYSEDKQLLGTSIHGAIQDVDVAYAFIRASDGKVLASDGRQRALTPAAMDTALPARATSRSVDRQGTRIIEFLAPITSEEAQDPGELLLASKSDSPRNNRPNIIGGVAVGLSLATVEQQLAAYLRFWVSITVGFLVISTLGIYVLSRQITRPINRLTEQAQRVATGALDQHIEVKSRDETGQLAVAFNNMTAALKGNIEDKERAYAELQELNRTLEQRIAERTAELEERSRLLALSSRHKSDFLANVSHELRTPMNAILGFNEMIGGGIYGEVPERIKGPLSDIHDSGKHLLRLINDVLDLSKIEAGHMQLVRGPYLVRDIVERVRTSLGSLAMERGLTFVASVPDDLPTCYCDGKRLTQCLMNLAGNAVKFTERGTVKISVARRGDELIFEVSDTGIGIAEDQIQHIFSEFRQADATISREFGGTGLGLSITKKFVEMHGGRIGVTSELGKGSTFFFSLPLHPEGGAAA